MRARHNHLVSTLRSDTTTLTLELIEQVRAAWVSYVQSKVAKGLVESDRPALGAERDAWPALVQQFQDRAWKQANLQRDEKFEMHFNAAVCMALRNKLCFMLTRK